jgi:hypothetical protein
VLFVINGDPAVARVVNIVTGVTEREIVLPTGHPVRAHGQFRHVRLTPNGTMVVANTQLNKVVEYDFDGNELWSFPSHAPWGVTPLPNGNLLITDMIGVREITRRGDAVWTFGPSEVPDYRFSTLQQAWRLSNGNTVIGNWVNEWNTKPEEHESLCRPARRSSRPLSCPGLSRRRQIDVRTVCCHSTTASLISPFPAGSS